MGRGKSMADFPDICPVSRKFTAAQFATKRFQSISGAGVTRLYGSKAFDAKLRLEFVVNDEVLIKIMDNWYASYGAYSALTLPESVIAGSTELLDAVTPDYLEWHWEQEPTVATVQPGLSRINVNLVARLEIS